MGMLDPAPTQANFSLLGMLLGGPSYASNWLGQRDILTQAANERARIGQAAQGLLASPQYRQVFNTPEMQDAGALWAKMQPDFSAMGNNLLSQKIGNLYGQQSTLLADKLDRERMGISMDQSLQMDAIKRQRDLEDQQKQFAAYAKLPGAMGATLYMTKLGLPAPGKDMLYTGNYDQRGVPEMIVQPGSETWMKGVDEIAPMKDIADSMQLLSDMASQKTPFDKGMWNGTRANLVTRISKAEGLGALGQDLIDYMNTLVPDHDRFTPEWFSGKASQLKMNTQTWKNRADLASKKWGIPVDEVPSSLRGILPTEPPPKDSPTAAQDQLKKALPAPQQPTRWDRSTMGR